MAISPAQSPKRVTIVCTVIGMNTPTLTFTLAGESTSVRELSYNNQLLFVTFTSGVTYCYYDVPLEAVKAVIGADSIGSALHHNIISQPFSFQRLER